MDAAEQTIHKAVLLVEGRDEADIARLLLKNHEIKGVNIEVIGGRGQLISMCQSMAVERMYRETSVFGIIFDSEDDPAETNQLLETAKTCFDAHPKSSNVQVKYLQLPSTTQAGSLEAICLASIKAEDEILSCVDTYMACISNSTSPLRTQAQKDKAKLMTWYIAATGNLITRIGYDITFASPDRTNPSRAQHMNFDSDAFKPLIQFLRDLVPDV